MLASLDYNNLQSDSKTWESSHANSRVKLEGADETGAGEAKREDPNDVLARVVVGAADARAD